MTIGLCTLEFRLPGCGSLKQKRSFLRRLRAKLVPRFNIAFSEIDHQDLWQRSLVGIVSVSNRRDVVDRTFQKVLREVERDPDGELIDVQMEYF